jgi:tetratricopeptide (TPR) repeat protein
LQIAPELLAFAKDDGYAPILRSIAMIESGRFPSPGQLQTASALLGSPDPLVRLSGVSALGGVGGANERLGLLKTVLADPVKSVRMAVARQLGDAVPGQAPEELRPALARLLDEYRESLMYNADMPEAMNDLALLLGGQGDSAGAARASQHAAKLAPGYLPAMLNLADAHRSQGREDLAEQVLKTAAARYPTNGDAQHALGLLLVRTGRARAAVPLFEQASRLAPDNARYALVFAVALVENDRRAEGLRVLQAAAGRFANDESIRQALEAFQAQERK